MSDGVMQVQAKGQVTIDQRLREEVGIRPGDRVVWVKNKDGRLELWKVEDLDALWEQAIEGLTEFSRRSKAGYAPKGAERRRRP